MKNLFVFLCVLFVLFNIVDVASTGYALENGAIEGNPVASFLFEQIGFFWSIIMFKLVGVLIVLICLNYVFKHKPLNALTLVSFIDGIMFMCILNNIMRIMLMS